jgi:hypothetical protein
MNQTLKTFLHAFCSYQQDDWFDYLPLTEFAFNNSKNSSIQQTPFYANMAFHPASDIQITERTTNPSSTKLTNCLDIIHAELQAELAHSNDYCKTPSSFVSSFPTLDCPIQFNTTIPHTGKCPYYCWLSCTYTNLRI